MEREQRERKERRKLAEIKFIREQKYRDYLLESRMSGGHYRTSAGAEQPYQNLDMAPGESQFRQRRKSRSQSNNNEGFIDNAGSPLPPSQ